MENWRKTTVEILRECPEEIHLEELYKKVKPFINDLDSLWKEGTRRTLAMNSSDSDIWDKKHDLFEIKSKGSGMWKLRTNFYREEI